MKDIGKKLILFSVLPFVGFIESFIRPWSLSSRTIIFLWFVVFGICFTPMNKEADSWRYEEEFRINSSATDAHFQEQISDYFHNYQSTQTRDIYIVVMTYLVSRLSTNFHFFFMALAFVFAFFYVKSMKFIVPLPNTRYDQYVVPILFFLFCLSNPIFNINGVRFWTAAWIAVFIVFQVLVNKKYIYLLLAPATILVHASFVIFVALLGLYFLLGRLDGLWRILFIISLFFAAVSFVPNLYLSSSIPLPIFLENEVNSYASDTAIADKQLVFQELPMYAQILNILPRILINAIAIVLMLSRKKINGNEENKRIMRYMIVLLTFVNFTFVIPSVGVRFFKMVFPLIVFLLIKQPEVTAKYKYMVYLLPFAFVLDIIYWFRHMADVTSLVDYIAPLPYLLVHYLL